MALHDDLLEQAKHLAGREPKKPRQASLRRAVSAAYYALFHLLVSEASRKLASSQPPQLRLQIRRAFVHGDMKSACEFFTGSSIVDPNSPANLLHLIALPLEPDLRRIAARFVELQQARHTADYDHLSPFSRANTLLKISQTEQAFLDWTAVWDRPNTKVFLTALEFHNRSRR